MVFNRLDTSYVCILEGIHEENILQSILCECVESNHVLTKNYFPLFQLRLKLKILISDVKKTIMNWLKSNTITTKNAIEWFKLGQSLLKYFVAKLNVHVFRINVF